MNHTLTKVALAAVAALMLGGAAQAGEVNITINADRGAYQPIRYDRDDCRDRRYIRAPDHDDECGGRYYGRPVRERHDWDRGRWHRERWSRPVFDRPHWQDDDDCRLIIKRRVNQWGDVVTRRIKVCG